jgi:hypothetical protein
MLTLATTIRNHTGRLLTEDKNLLGASDIASIAVGLPALQLLIVTAVVGLTMNVQHYHHLMCQWGSTFRKRLLLRVLAISTACAMSPSLATYCCRA